MFTAPRFAVDDLPDLPHARQLRAGFPWLTFAPDLEAEFRRAHLEENLPHIRVNLVLAVVVTLACSAVEAMVLGANPGRIPGMIHLLVMVPTILAALAASFSPDRERVYPRVALAAGILLGVSVVTVVLIASLAGVSLLFPCLLLTIIFTHFMGGLIFYHALAANVFVALVYIVAGSSIQIPARELGYDAIMLVAANVFCASVVYMHEKTARMRFLEAALLHEMVARDGLTGIQNRRMFDQHIQHGWQQAVREKKRMAVLLIDIDCFKNFNDRYGHQAGDECLRAVAVSLHQCARRPLDFVARYGGEEFAVVLFDAGREYLAEVSTRIQRSIAQLNIPHEASIVAGRLTVSIGAAHVLPAEGRTPDGLVQLADEALYSAKEQGRNRVVVMETEYQTLRTGRFDMNRGRRIG